ncbi:MAG: HAD family phosphatase [Bacteroidia bacterium]
MSIKNIIFDLGGVLLPLNMKATIDGFKNLGATDFDSIYSQQEQRHFFDQFDKGLITDDEFRMEIKKYVREDVSNQQIDEAWNSMLGIIPQTKIDFLKKVNERYRVFLLSNTNSIHVKKFEGDHQHRYKENIFQSLFQKTYYSCNIGMRKPDEEIFRYVIDDSNLVPGETIFIDDSPQHIKGALPTGLQAHHLDLNKDTVETLFFSLIR